jgi:hypothetical protein
MIGEDFNQQTKLFSFVFCLYIIRPSLGINHDIYRGMTEVKVVCVMLSGIRPAEILIIRWLILCKCKLFLNHN